MTQGYEYNIKKEIADLFVNYRNRAIRSTTDYQILTIGRVQIENLDWRWFENGVQLRSLMMYDPYDCMFRHGIHGNGKGNFNVIKYGLSYREKPLTLASYTPLWKPGTKPEEQAKIMWTEMQKMMENGSRKCENGIEIVPDSQLWNTVDTLATRARNTFRTSLGRKVQDLESRGIRYDAEKVWNMGVPVTSEIVTILGALNRQMAK